MFLLTLGVIFGFGSGFAHLHRWRHGGCHDWRDGRWSDTRGVSDWREARDAQPAPAATPQTVVVPPSAAPAPQVFVIMPQGVATPQVVTVPVAATPAPGGNVAPPATAP